MERDELEAMLRELVARAQTGDQAAFTELYRRVAPVAFRLGRAHVRDPHVLQQLVDDTFLKATTAYDPERGKSYLAFLRLKWTGVFDDHFKSPGSGRLGLSKPPRDEKGRLKPIAGEDVDEHFEPGRRDWLDMDLATREWLLRWRPVRDKVREQISADGGDAERQRCLRRALDVVAMRALFCGPTDSELARELGCHPKQARRYIDYVLKMLRPYFLPKEEDS